MKFVFSIGLIRVFVLLRMVIRIILLDVVYCMCFVLVSGFIVIIRLLVKLVYMLEIMKVVSV